MYIDRNVVARFLETKTSNIRRAWQDTNGTICVQRWDSKEKVYMTEKQYKNFIEALKINPNLGIVQNQKNSRGNQSNWGILLMIVGALIVLAGYSRETTVSTEIGQISNLSLMNAQSNQIQIGGICFISGILLYCLDNKKTSS